MSDLNGKVPPKPNNAPNLPPSPNARPSFVPPSDIGNKKTPPTSGATPKMPPSAMQPVMPKMPPPTSGAQPKMPPVGANSNAPKMPLPTGNVVLPKAPQVQPNVAPNIPRPNVAQPPNQTPAVKALGKANRTAKTKQPTIPSVMEPKQKAVSLNEVLPSWNRAPDDVVKKSQITILSLLAGLVLVFAGLMGVLWMIVAPPNLIALSRPEVQLNQAENKLQWERVPNARWYEIFVNNLFYKNTLDTEFLLSDYAGQDLTGTMKVRASKNGIYSHSGFSAEIAFDVRTLFAAPELELNEEDLTIVLALVEDVREYEVFDGETLLEVISLPEEHEEQVYLFAFSNYISNDIGKKYEFKVRAKENEFGKNSDFSQGVVFEKYLSLLVPVVEREDLTLRLDNQLGASAFEIVLNNAFASPILVENAFLSNQIVIDLEDYVTQPGNYSVQVRAVGKDEYNLDSEFSEEILFSLSGYFAPPTNLAFDTSTKILTWTAVNGALNYLVFINGTEFATVAGTSLNLSGVFADGNAYDIELQTNSNPPFYASEKSQVFRAICSLLLSAPTNSYIDENKVFHWDVVPNAVNYSVFVNGTKYTVTQNYFNLSSLFNKAQQYTVYVKAEGDNVLFLSSSPTTLIYYDNKLPLGTPTNLRRVTTSVAWDSVKDAGSYKVEVYENQVFVKEEIVVGTSILIADLDLTEGIYDLFVIALPSGAARFASDSAKSNALQLVYQDVSIPTNLVFNQSTKTLTWDADLVASSYVVAIDNQLHTVTSNSLSLSSILTAEQIVQAKVKAVSGFDGKQTAFSPILMVNNTTAVPGYTDRYFFFEKWNDFKITSLQEIHMLSWYVRTVQLVYVEANCVYTPNLTFYEDFKAGLGLFGETGTIVYTWRPANESSPILQVNLAYNSQVMGENLAPLASEEGGVKNFEQATILKARTAITRDRDDNFNDFYINQNVLVEVEVLNSDHLVNIMASGAKPVFTSTNPKAVQAQTVYNNILQVNRQIIRNDFSDFEKVLAIYDYLIYNGYYDHDTLELGKSADANVRNAVTKINSFYLEGLFLNMNKQMAVCDAFAKSFVVMCRIEGIEAIKINGVVDQVGAHAWNKVKLVVPGQTEAKWFFVDATFDNLNLPVEGTTYLETLLHQYFLISDIQMMEYSGLNRIVNQRMYNPDATTTFHVYSYISKDYGRFGGTASMNLEVTSQSELADVISFLNASQTVFAVELYASYFTMPQRQDFATDELWRSARSSYVNTQLGMSGATEDYTFYILQRTNLIVITKSGLQ